MPETAKNLDEKVRQLQRKLYVCARQSRTRRFHALYDRIHSTGKQLYGMGLHKLMGTVKYAAQAYPEDHR